MKPIAITALLVLTLAHGVTVTATEKVNSSSKQTVINNLSAMSLAFTQNDGQWPDSILYRANAGGATMWFTPNGAYYQFTRRVDRTNSSATGSDPLMERMPYPDREGERDSIESMMIKASFVGCNPNPLLEGAEQLEYKCNYFIGNDQSKWRTDVPNYTSITYKEVYPGIDLKYYGDGRRMEYDFIVPPGADYSQIKIQYEGAKSLTVSDVGDLVIETSWGTVHEKAPVVYQTDREKRTAISGVYRLADDNSFSFTLGAEYNRSLPVVIDPVLSYSTFLGGSSGGGAYPRDIAVDGAGSAYVTGWTTSADFPIVTPFDGSLTDSLDAFVTKLSPAGNSLVYSTYMGGSGVDYSEGIAVDRAGSAYVTGGTASADFPTANAYDGSLTGISDAFVTKLSPTGNSLVYSSYLGGGSGDYGNDIAVGGAGSAYLTGATSSSDFPTATPFDVSFNGGLSDVFVTKLSPAGNSLVYSTYLGGSSADYDVGRGIAVDSAGSAYVTGGTKSSDFPTANPYDGSLNGNWDAFVTKLSPSGSSLVYSSFLGGIIGDWGHGIAVDEVGSAYVTGETWSTDFPTANPYDGSLDDYSNAFVTKLSPAGNSLAYSTHLGGNSSDYGDGIAVDGAGSAYVSGWTTSADFPTSATTLDNSLGGPLDAFVTKLNSAGNDLIYSTYLGGSGEDRSYCIAVDGAGNAYVTGETYSSDFPTANPFDGIYNGGEAFVTKVQLSSCCIGTTGNIDCDLENGIDISDLTRLIDFLYVSLSPLCCPEEANVDGDPGMGIDISDLTRLIDYLYISFTPPAVCQ